MNIAGTLVVATDLTFILCVAGQVRPNQPQLLAQALGVPFLSAESRAQAGVFVDPNQTKTLFVGEDSPHSLFIRISVHIEPLLYHANRASYGINAV